MKEKPNDGKNKVVGARSGVHRERSRENEVQGGDWSLTM